MLMIRFQRVGKKNQPSFRVVLTEKYRGPRRKYLEELGFYNPRVKTAQLKADLISRWLSKGAKASPSCHNLFVREGVISGSKIKKEKIKATAKERVEIKAETVEAAPILDKIDKSE